MDESHTKAPNKGNECFPRHWYHQLLWKSFIFSWFCHSMIIDKLTYKSGDTQHSNGTWNKSCVCEMIQDSTSTSCQDHWKTTEETSGSQNSGRTTSSANSLAPASNTILAEENAQVNEEGARWKRWIFSFDFLLYAQFYLVFVFCQARKESVETLSTSRRVRCSLWLTLCTRWPTPYTACTWTCVPATWGSVRRWTPWKDRCSSNIFALSASMVSCQLWIPLDSSCVTVRFWSYFIRLMTVDLYKNLFLCCSLQRVLENSRGEVSLKTEALTSLC